MRLSLLGFARVALAALILGSAGPAAAADRIAVAAAADLRFALEGDPCPRCTTPVRRMVQARRATYFCPRCQVR